jgi:hypothetical protein
VYGYKVTSKINGNHIFIPAAGYNKTTYIGSRGYYWLNSYADYSPSFAWIGFMSNTVEIDYIMRFNGCSIRPVCP